jgi:hypothetical protein
LFSQPNIFVIRSVLTTRQSLSYISANSSWIGLRKSNWLYCTKELRAGIKGAIKGGVKGENRGKGKFMDFEILKKFANKAIRDIRK